MRRRPPGSAPAATPTPSGQRSQGAVGFGAPLFDAAGDVFGDVCITIPEGRFDPAQEPKLGGLLVSAAADISADLRGAGFLRDT